MLFVRLADKPKRSEFCRGFSGVCRFTWRTFGLFVPGTDSGRLLVSYPDNCNTWPVVAAASANFLSGNRSALSLKLASIMTPGAGGPATITKSAGDGQSTPVGQAFPTLLAVTVTDTTGTPVAGASVTFTVTPGATGASEVFSSTGPVLIATDQNGNATAPVLTANSVPGQFTVTAFVNALTAAFT